jgi:hypothetical protein
VTCSIAKEEKAVPKSKSGSVICTKNLHFSPWIDVLLPHGTCMKLACVGCQNIVPGLDRIRYSSVSVVTKVRAVRPKLDLR